MRRIQGFSRILSSGAPAASCTVTVYDAGTVNVSTIYGDDLSTPTPKSNPFAADANGYYFFYAPGIKQYDVQLSGGGIASPYTITTETPAGAGNGALMSVAVGSLPATSAAHAGRLRRASDSRGGLFLDSGSGWDSVLDFGLDSKTVAGLPAAGTAGRLRRVTDGFQGLYVDDGAAWNSVLGYGHPSSTRAGLPTPALTGRLRLVTNDARGLWQDAGAGTSWFGVAGERVNVVEFGALRNGADDAAAIQAAIDALSTSASGGVVFFPKGTYTINSPIKIRNLVTLEGYGVILSASTSFSGNSMIQCFRRDDNVPGNEDRVGMVGQWVLSSAAFAPEASLPCAIDLTGMCDSYFVGLRLLGRRTGVGAGAGTAAIRVSDQNIAGTSSKTTRGNLFEQIKVGLWEKFLTVSQAVDGRCENNAFFCCRVGAGGVVADSTGVRTGIDLTGITAGAPSLLFMGNRITGDGTSGSPIACTAELPNNIVMIGNTFAGWQPGGFTFGDTVIGGRFGMSVSGTRASTAVAPGGATPTDFQVSAYFKISSGTVIPAGVSTYSYTLTNYFPANFGYAVPNTWSVIPVSGMPQTPFQQQATVVNTVLTLTLVTTAQVTLPADYIFRVFLVGP